MKKNLLLLTLLSLSLSLTAQEKKGRIVTREVLLVKKYQGSYSLRSGLDTTPVNTAGTHIISATLMGDDVFYIILPYDKNKFNGLHWPINAYMTELGISPYVYNYPDIFVAETMIPASFGQFSAEESLGYKKRIKTGTDPDKLAPGWRNNDTFIMQINTGSVAKIWVINAEWEELTIFKKPAFFSAFLPRTVYLDKYKILTLRKLLSIKAISTLDSKEDERSLVAKSKAELTIFKNIPGNKQH